jgi:hypothetical protein
MYNIRLISIVMMNPLLYNEYIIIKNIFKCIIRLKHLHTGVCNFSWLNTWEKDYGS